MLKLSVWLLIFKVFSILPQVITFSPTAIKGWSSSLEVGRGANKPLRKKTTCYEVLHRASGGP